MQRDTRHNVEILCGWVEAVMHGMGTVEVVCVYVCVCMCMRMMKTFGGEPLAPYPSSLGT